jgi:hypothetical protein
VSDLLKIGSVAFWREMGEGKKNDLKLSKKVFLRLVEGRGDGGFD